MVLGCPSTRPVWSQVSKPCESARLGLAAGSNLRILTVAILGPRSLLCFHAEPCCLKVPARFWYTVLTELETHKSLDSDRHSVSSENSPLQASSLLRRSVFGWGKLQLYMCDTSQPQVVEPRQMYSKRNSAFQWCSKLLMRTMPARLSHFDHDQNPHGFVNHPIVIFPACTQFGNDKDCLLTCRSIRKLCSEICLECSAQQFGKSIM